MKIVLQVRYSPDGATELTEHHTGFSKAYADQKDKLQCGAYWADIWQFVTPNAQKLISRSK